MSATTRKKRAVNVDLEGSCIERTGDGVTITTWRGEVEHVIRLKFENVSNASYLASSTIEWMGQRKAHVDERLQQLAVDLKLARGEKL